ncbi:Calpain-type cysteine protease ADL1 (Phytocalpain ADL1) (Protein ADAXIALIZED LEAF1) (Protein DEFECTIVE KERNEL 1) (OsDEK1) (Protein SHOOTLESS 3) [Durusdinium trenchii]|uniref:Calpain-type cysteine protease ADL1 (Phytocalpain ADL1) (Protein ADAXIALIZED LEAF1) (Protein DEFECTIVE KERNEL 1) (OsDEK1) (Protein SHOOTLESS 3) n=1 Tax=Durusdinium trenchii TaxID=1381693 RepID=A0ABP0MFX6_9DINO
MSLTWKDTICCWQKLMVGRACCFYNTICCPFVLCCWAGSIYCCGCARVYMNRGLYKFCCCLCRAFNCCWLYTDKDFPPEELSLGDVKGDSAGDEAKQFAGKVTWVRGGKFPVPKDEKGNKRHMQLFSREIDSRDICQGALGDCWLLAAIACMAEHDGAIQAVFRTKEVNPRGKYVLRLYDGAKEKWEIITIDDFIPCNKASFDHDGTPKPFFSKPKHNELYVMLLEKAFAKFCGGYSALEGGQTIWAIRAMTGDPARQFSRNDSKSQWQRQDLKNFDDPKDKRKCGLYSTKETVDNDTMFEILRKYHSLGSILSASGASGKDGLVTGHAYSPDPPRGTQGQRRVPGPRREGLQDDSDPQPLGQRRVERGLERQERPVEQTQCREESLGVRGQG